MAFIFEPVWSILNPLQYIGAFPCKKVSTEADGCHDLHPLSWPRILFPEVLKSIILGLLLVFVYYHQGLDFYSDLNSAFDVATLVGNSITATMMNQFTIVQNLRFRYQLEECQRLIGPMVKTSRDKSKLKKSYVFMATIIGIAYILVGFTFGYQMKLHYGVWQSWIIRILISATLCIVSCLMYAPMLAFYMAFGEISQSLVQALDMMINEKGSLKYCFDCLKSIENVVNSMQKHFLVCVTCSLFGLTGFIFYGFSFIISKYYLNFGLCISFICSIVFSLIHGQWLYFLNSQSEEVKNKYLSLKEYILTNFAQAENGAKELTLFQIEKFHGYSACDYFYLGKPFLSSLTGTFITYLVILIQFKLSEQQQ